MNLQRNDLKHATDHARSAVVTDEGISKHLSQLAGSERQVRPSSAERPDAFFQGQQALVDFSAFHSRLSVGTRRVGPSFVSCLVEKTKPVSTNAQLVRSQPAQVSSAALFDLEISFL